YAVGPRLVPPRSIDVRADARADAARVAAVALAHRTRARPAAEANLGGRWSARRAVPVGRLLHAAEEVLTTATKLLREERHGGSIQGLGARVPVRRRLGPTPEHELLRAAARHDGHRDQRGRVD